jgi:hypothetical protein
MSTRCNIVIKEGKDKLIFYKHSDGYPEGTLPLLNEFLDGVKSGKFRDNVVQSAGHLILLGAKNMALDFGGTIPAGYQWKVGSIEPTTCIHGDIQYLYTIDLVKKTIKTKKV